jgi:hypothetical protein
MGGRQDDALAGRRRIGSAGRLAMTLVVAGALVVAATVGWAAYRRSQNPDLPTGVPGQQRPARIALFGDSLAEDASSFFQAGLTAHGRAQVELQTLPGTAICDWFKAMTHVVGRMRPDAVVVEFSGNNLTPCVQNSAKQPLVGAALLARYQADAIKATQILIRHGATVYWAGAPADRSDTLSAQAAAVRSIYEQLPARFPQVHFVPAGTVVLLDGTTYTDYLPCLPNEPCTGPTIGGKRTNRVRAPDGVHFCPVVVTGRHACPVWSSGAFRFGTAMAAPVIAQFGL